VVENNEGEQQAALQIEQIYNRVQRQVYLFLAAALVTIVLTSLYLIRSNRAIFARMATLSEQRSELAQEIDFDAGVERCGTFHASCTTNSDRC